MNKENSQCRNKGKYEQHRRTHCKISAATFLWFIKCLISGIKDAIVLQIQNSQQGLVQVLRRELGATLPKLQNFENSSIWRCVAGAACFFSIKNVALAKKCKKVKSNWKVCCAFFCSWDCIGQECSRNRNIAEIYLWPKNKSIFLAKKCEGWPLSVLSVAIYRGTEAVIRDSTDICDVGKLFIFSLFPYFKQNCKVFIGQENEN